MKNIVLNKSAITFYQFLLLISFSIFITFSYAYVYSQEETTKEGETFVEEDFEEESDKELDNDIAELDKIAGTEFVEEDFEEEPDEELYEEEDGTFPEMSTEIQIIKIKNIDEKSSSFKTRFAIIMEMPEEVSTTLMLQKEASAQAKEKNKSFLEKEQDFENEMEELEKEDDLALDISFAENKIEKVENTEEIWGQFDFTNMEIVAKGNENVKVLNDTLLMMAKFDAIVHHDYDLSKYPFDKQKFKLEITDIYSNSDDHDIYADKSSLYFSSDAIPSGWKLVDYNIEIDSSFEYVSKEDTPAGNHRITAAFELQRDNPRLFLSLFATLYLAYLLSFIALMLPTGDYFNGAKNSLILGAVFSLMSNFLSASDVLKGSVSSMNLVDIFQLVTMGLLMGSIIVIFTCQWMRRKECKKQAQILRFASSGVSLVVFILTNIFLLSQ